MAGYGVSYPKLNGSSISFRVFGRIFSSVLAIVALAQVVAGYAGICGQDVTYGEVCKHCLPTDTHNGGGGQAVEVREMDVFNAGLEKLPKRLAEKLAKYPPPAQIPKKLAARIAVYFAGVIADEISRNGDEGLKADFWTLVTENHPSITKVHNAVRYGRRIETPFDKFIKSLQSLLVTGRHRIVKLVKDPKQRADVRKRLEYFQTDADIFYDSAFWWKRIAEFFKHLDGMISKKPCDTRPSRVGDGSEADDEDARKARLAMEEWLTSEVTDCPMCTEGRTDACVKHGAKGIDYQGGRLARSLAKVRAERIRREAKLTRERYRSVVAHLPSHIAKKLCYPLDYKIPEESLIPLAVYFAALFAEDIANNVNYQPIKGRFWDLFVHKNDNHEGDYSYQPIDEDKHPLERLIEDLHSQLVKERRKDLLDLLADPKSRDYVEQRMELFFEQDHNYPFHDSVTWWNNVAEFFKELNTLIGTGKMPEETGPIYGLTLIEIEEAKETAIERFRLLVDQHSDRFIGELLDDLLEKLEWQRFRHRPDESHEWLAKQPHYQLPLDLVVLLANHRQEDVPEEIIDDILHRFFDRISDQIIDQLPWLLVGHLADLNSPDIDEKTMKEILQQYIRNHITLNMAGFDEEMDELIKDVPLAEPSH
ncbi:uncharacterized protein BXIN_2434 [Babesia sp. Xinjiang]|uniref:uncharacterized protein n=1 Tax=Babesia sp. Xinjiang TaxID=462227 RepID=UPI000A25EE91|nr:uncharacterized protein BXIN_2434 [Babesia sp. Xinjiang]ORM41462.1 hypothetical protein BXIN_2434 [Babesia sp. Xinjiang]